MYFIYDQNDFGYYLVLTFKKYEYFENTAHDNVIINILGITEQNWLNLAKTVSGYKLNSGGLYYSYKNEIEKALEIFSNKFLGKYENDPYYFDYIKHECYYRPILITTTKIIIDESIICQVLNINIENYHNFLIDNRYNKNPIFTNIVEEEIKKIVENLNIKYGQKPKIFKIKTQGIKRKIYLINKINF